MKNKDSLADPERVDSPDGEMLFQKVITTKRITVRPRKKTNYIIDGEKYPKLSLDNKFIPQRRIIHLDLKGAPYKPSFFPYLFAFFNQIKATGVLIEWEDMFPYKGRLAEAVNKNAYDIQTVRTILGEARKHHLEIIPLVQTMGHLEWILKLKKFAHLREDSRFPQVICFSDDEAWNLISEMISEVADLHKEFGMNYFHMGADEAFQIGICNASIVKLRTESTRERLMLWHMSRTANFIKKNYNDVTVLAWHDMLVNAMEPDLDEYGVVNLIQPVLWNYAEDLDLYLPRSTWSVLKNFGNIWASSAWKGADGPARYATHSEHYIKNHESWVTQLNTFYKDFEAIEGIIMSGWSRYDHLAVLAELAPVALPTLAMSMETILEAKHLNSYPITNELLQCSPPVGLGYSASGCSFPGSRVYELVNDLYQKRRQLRSYREDDYELNGWMSRMADDYIVSSHWYIDKIQPMIEMHALPLEQLELDLRNALSSIYYNDTVDEFIFTYLEEDLHWIRRKRETMKKISEASEFPRRPFIMSSKLRDECGNTKQ
ncbi:unnamed protein product [Caenorhabditis bovis]|uniref:beta-N-acetylhexosaminidase n=1 Tax=Caenorhabditis bovis TaxID=2654633 RepID=A0A8S1EQD9_9PELO|nr:unnamed protein product [Caenorhabditis bovis]